MLQIFHGATNSNKGTNNPEKKYRYNSCFKDFIHFCACAGKWLLKHEEQNFQKKTLITLLFKFKALVIGNKSDLDRDINFFHVVYAIRVSVDTRKINQVFDINCHLSIPCCQVMQIENSYNWCGCIHTGYKQESLRMELKMTHLDFFILNSHVTVTFLRFIKSSNFCLW